jgi:hypothetical protein
VFAGIGKILMSADRPQAGAPVTAQPASGTERRAARRPRPGSAPAPESRWRSLDQTGNVRLLSAEDLEDDPGAEPAGTPAASEPASGRSATSREASIAPVAGERASIQAASSQTASAQPDLAAEPGPAAALPLPDYDTLSLASIRARLRGLDVPQLRILVEYESRNAERPEVLGMFERRIEKLGTGR